LWVLASGLGRAAVAEATTMIASGKLYTPVAATYPLSAIEEAVAHAERGGEILAAVNGAA